jgi:hypothetical protein
MLLEYIQCKNFPAAWYPLCSWCSLLILMVLPINRLQFANSTFQVVLRNICSTMGKHFFIDLCAQVWPLNIFRKKLLLIAAWCFLHTRCNGSISTHFQNHHVKIIGWSLFPCSRKYVLLHENSTEWGSKCPNTFIVGENSAEACADTCFLFKQKDGLGNGQLVLLLACDFFTGV